MTQRQYLNCKSAMFDTAGVPHPKNVLRHSFCSYHVALHKNASTTAVLLQHTNQSTLYRHYKGRASIKDAEEYFKILP